MLYYQMIRGGEVVAHVVVLPNRTCIVSWPTSIIVYDDEEAARAVHIGHMGGRGEHTSFRYVMATKPVDRGFMEAYQDDCEGVPARAAHLGEILVPAYIADEERGDFAFGYESYLLGRYGANWKTFQREDHATYEAIE